MKLLCVIDDLGPGGAERQMAGLSTMLHENGHQVAVAYHEPKHFFAEQIKAAGVEVCHLPEAANAKKRVFVYRKFIKLYRPDIVIAYLQGACITACLVKASGIKFKLIVSERNTNQTKTWRDSIRFNIFRYADYVVPNSYSQEKFIKEYFSFLNRNVFTITNFVDTEKFVPGVAHERRNLIVVAATIWPSKNTLGLIKAVNILREKGLQFRVKWFGKVPGQSDYISQCQRLIDELGLKEYIELLDKTQNIIAEYQRADIFCLPSFYEGTPNVICEAMSCGLPILCSNVCDNARYVTDDENGFLFDPQSVDSIAEKFEKIIYMEDKCIYKFGMNSRKIAEACFSKELFVNKYLDLIQK